MEVGYIFKRKLWQKSNPGVIIVPKSNYNIRFNYFHSNIILINIYDIYAIDLEHISLNQKEVFNIHLDKNCKTEKMKVFKNQGLGNIQMSQKDLNFKDHQNILSV